jgi:hypothetical protein
MELKLISVGVVALLFYGVSQRSRPRIHMPVMALAFLIDLSMVVYIELNRHAIEQAVHPTSGLMKVHLFCSIVAVLLYPVQIGSGLKKYLWGGVAFHKYTGAAFLFFRVGNLITSFLIPTHPGTS